MSSRYSGQAHQRDLRTQLFSSGSGGATPRPLLRTASPYEAVPTELARQNEAFLASLEEGNNQEMDEMSQKVGMLKDLGVRMGLEINKLLKLNDEITNLFELGRVKLKNTMNQMIIMSKRAGITWKMWLLVLLVVGVFFFWVWIR